MPGGVDCFGTSVSGCVGLPCWYMASGSVKQSVGMAVSVVSGALSSFGDSCVSSSISAVTQSSSSTGSNIENGALTASASDWSGANSMAISSASSMSLKVPIPFIVTLPLSASPSAIKVANSFKKADARLSLQPH